MTMKLSSESPEDDTKVEQCGMQFDGRFGKDSNYPSSSFQGRTLLSALRDVIYPLIHMPAQNCQDLSDTPMGSEAEDLLVALQKYIRSVVRDQSLMDGKKVLTTQKTSLEDVSTEISVEIPVSCEVGGEGESTRVEDKLKLNRFYEESSVISRILIGEIDDDLDAQSGELETLLTNMHAHVFNDLPIRLLCFDKRNGPEVEISLLNRSELYSYFAESIMAEFPSLPRNDSVRRQLVNGNFISVNYAILSHTWLRSGSGEVTYENWNRGHFDLTHPGYQKLANFCRVASEDDGLSLGWIDTVCIDKSSSSELDESIRSMYKWYQNASVCITYLAETACLSDMVKDPWFTRGWTLQELLAPDRLKFYDRDWKQFIKYDNDKENTDIQEKIELATTITKDELLAPSSVPISRKMQWAAKRQVTRGEDIAYSLMGIFNISMPIAYGEGADLAFVRLVKEILITPKSNTLDIFNWGGCYGTNISALLPSSPRAYLRRTDLSKCLQPTVVEPLMPTHLGLRVPVVLLPAVPVSGNTKFTPKGTYYATVTLTDPSSNDSSASSREASRSYNILDIQAFRAQLFWTINQPHTRWVFAVLNFSKDKNDIIIPETCFAVAVQYTSDVSMPHFSHKIKLPTTDPITFQLRNKKALTGSSRTDHHIKINELEHHGMQCTTTYF